MNKIKILALVLAMVPAFVSAQGWKSKTMMTVGDKSITAGEFMAVYEKNNVTGEVIDKKSVDDYLDLYVNFKLKVIEAENLGMDTLPKFQKELNGYRSQLAKPYFSNEEATEKLIEEAYERMKWDISASHILIKCDVHAIPADTLAAYNKAMEIRSRIMKGEDFNRVAVEVSDDPSARDHKEIPGKQRAYKGNRGYLGYFTAFDMVYPFESGAYNAKVGEVSMPVRSDFGYHLIMVHSKTPAFGSVRAAHIYLSVDDKDPLRTDSLVFAKINNIYNEIDPTGKNWPEMVRKYSEDKGTFINNGQLTPFKVNQIVPEFIEALKGLKVNEFSRPVKTPYGYHIVQLVATSGIGNFEKESENIKKRVEKDMRASVSDEVVLQRLMKDNKFKENLKVKDAFMATVDSTLTLGAYVVSPTVNVNQVVFKINKDNYTLQNFIDYMIENQKVEPFLSPAAFAYELYDKYVKKANFDYEDAHLEQKYPDFKMLVQEYHDGILLFDLMENEVWNKATQDTVGLNNFYEEHKGEYMWSDRVKAIVITTTKSALVDTLNLLVNQGLTADSIRAIVKADKKLGGVSVKTLHFQKGENVDVDAMDWVAGTIKTVPSTVDNTTKIYKILDVRQPEPKTFKEAKGVIISAYQNQLEAAWMSSLKEKYQVVIDQKMLEKVRSTYNN